VHRGKSMSEKERLRYIDPFFWDFGNKLTRYYDSETLDANMIGEVDYFFIPEDKVKREECVNVEFEVYANIPEDEYESKDVYIEAKIKNVGQFNFIIPLEDDIWNGGQTYFGTDDNTMYSIGRKRKILVMDFDDFFQKIGNIYNEIKGYIKSDQFSLYPKFYEIFFFLEQLQKRLKKQFHIISEIMISKEEIKKAFDINLKEKKKDKYIEEVHIDFETHSQFGGVDIEMIHTLSFDGYISINSKNYSKPYYGQNVPHANLHGIIKYKKSSHEFRSKDMRFKSTEEFIDDLKPDLHDALEEMRDQDLEYFMSIDDF